MTLCMARVTLGRSTAGNHGDNRALGSVSGDGRACGTSEAQGVGFIGRRGVRAGPQTICGYSRGPSIT